MASFSDLTELMDTIEKSPENEARIPLYEEAVRIADQLTNRKYAFDLRIQLIYYAVFYGHFLKAMSAFAVCLAEAEKKDGVIVMNDIIWEYKWINNRAPEFYEIPASRILKLNEDFKEKLQECGYNLHSYYYALMNRGINFWDKEFAKSAFEMMQKTPRDRMSDCVACVQDGLVEYALFMDDYPLAKRLSLPILNKNMSCAEVPHLTYAALLMPAFYSNDIKFAAEIEKKGYILVNKNPEFLISIANYMLYYAFTNPEKALNCYSKFVGWSFNPYNTKYSKWKFASLTAAMFTVLVSKNISPSKMLLPKEHPLYNEKGEYALTELKEYHYNIAKEIGEKFDKRNGNFGYKNALAEEINKAEAHITSN